MSLRFMLLGIIKDQPVSGYDLNKYFKMVVHFFWSADQSRIYRTLHEMESDGLVRVECVEQADSPDKKLYHITEAGRAELKHWLEEPAPSLPNRMPWLGQIFFADDLSTEETIALLQRRITQLEAELAELERRVHRDSLRDFITNPATARSNRMHALTLDYGIQSVRFQLGWLHEAIEMIQQGDEQG